ncbi:hypothetical protein [Bradyrhizobium sp. 150]|uniref:hypothetical protein n=1 Tax=Bradyrhizobium sp. 150 TaxID=2782625 RepID=UPI001FF9DF74|nr:hypothetical protein [Bradyrhizobium sp. 150]MCK1671048.1 hypothetical protein [Bradyrhizobium sp. 150]
MRRPVTTVAYTFQIYECGDPNCGPHFVAVDQDDEPICEIVIPLASTPSVIQALQEILLNKNREALN